jgi:hypothetical protein
LAGNIQQVLDISNWTSPTFSATVTRHIFRCALWALAITNACYPASETGRKGSGLIRRKLNSFGFPFWTNAPFGVYGMIAFCPRGGCEALQHKKRHCDEAERCAGKFHWTFLPDGIGFDDAAWALSPSLLIDLRLVRARITDRIFDRFY